MPSQLSTARSIISRGIFDDLQTFSQLEDRISALGQENTKILGDAFEIFVEGYLATQQKLLVDENWVVGQIPLPVREQMNLPNDTKGIDGIFRTRTGSLVPYQVKFRSRRAYLTYTEVAPFLGLTERATDRIIFTNSNEVALDAKNRDAMRTVRGIDFDELTQEDFEAIAGWLKEQPVIVPKPQPRDYQIEGIDSICNVFAVQDRATAVMACGTGKTLLALWVAERLQPKTVLVLLPSLTLVQQTLDEWSRHNSWGNRFSYICVCSDRTVAGPDAVELHNMDVEFPVSTDPAQVRAFLELPADQVRVVFSTYQSSKIVSEGAEGLAPFDLGIFDEAHKTTGPKGGLFAHSLSDDNVEIRKRLFLTATPRHYDIRHRDREGDFKLISMDDESVYGPRAFTLTFGGAAKRGIICDYKVVISVVEGREITQFALDHGFTLVEGDQMGAKWVASQLAIERAIEKTSSKRAITFHSRVAMAKEFASNTSRGIQQFLDGFSLFHVNGKQKSSERKQVIRAFREAPKAIITNARCLTEGIDIPAVDMVAFVDPRHSKVDIAQAAGRAMRKPYGSNKSVGYIVVPLFLEREGDETLEVALKRSDFSDVAEVLNAMQEQDDDLVEIIQSLKMAKGRGEVFDPEALKDKIDMLGPAVELDDLTARITAEIVDRIGASWDEWFGLLQAYQRKHGDCLVSQNYIAADGSKLGIWVSTQRARQSRISPQRRQRLEDIGFVWDPLTDRWEAGIDALEAYWGERGDSLVARDYIDADGFKLGGWVSRVRGSRNILNPRRRQRLDDLGFSWDPLTDEWEDAFAALKAYQLKYGNSFVSQRYITPDGFKLGVWVSTQRAKQKSLSRERWQMLEDLGFVWDPFTVAWESGYTALKTYWDEHGDCLVSPNYIAADGSKLGVWVYTQRAKLTALPPERRHRLDELGFVWDQRTKRWDAKIVALKAYQRERRDCLVERDYIDADGFKLGRWVSKLRSSRDSLSPQRRKALDDLGFVWDPRTQGWEDGFAALKAYRLKYGDCLVPIKYTTAKGLKLGQWVSVQRSTQRTMQFVRREKLDKLGFIWKVH